MLRNELEKLRFWRTSYYIIVALFKIIENQARRNVIKWFDFDLAVYLTLFSL